MYKENAIKNQTLNEHSINVTARTFVHNIERTLSERSLLAGFKSFIFFHHRSNMACQDVFLFFLELENLKKASEQMMTKYYFRLNCTVHLKREMLK